MEIVRAIFSGLIGGFLNCFQGFPALLSLAPLSLLLGVAMLWLFRRLSPAEAVLQAKRRMAAHLYELRLFADEPALVWRAQKGLLRANLRYLRLMLLPAAILAAPAALLFAQLEMFYGIEPLPIGQPALVTLQMSQPLDPQAPPPALQAPAGIAVETPAVRSFADRQLTWRIRPTHALSGNLRILLPKQTLEKTIQAGQGPSYLSDRRVRSAWDLLWHPAEKRLPAGPVEWVHIAYPPSALRWGWIELPWIVWLFLFSLLSPLLLRWP